MAGSVRLAISALPAHVRTARLVAVTVARRAGFPEDVVESVRQGVGEACGLVVRAADPGVTVRLTLHDAPGDLVVTVTPAPHDIGPHDGELARAVLEGLTDDFELSATADGEALRLHWHA